MLAPAASAGVVAAPQSDRAIAQLSGPVKSVRFEVIEVESDTGKLDTERMPKREDWYDPAGNLTEEKYHTPDFIDDRHPQRIDAQTWLLKSNMGDKRRHRAFDSGGRLTEETIYMENDAAWEVLDWTRFNYDPHNRLIESDDIRDGKVDGFTLMTRDAEGKLVQMEFHYNGNHAPFPSIWYEDYKIDRYGNWTERRVYEFNPENHKPKRAFSAIDYQVIEYYDDSTD
jgi:hypothetical protein